MSVEDGPVVLVTGANRGIGLELARAMIERGYLVALGVRDVLRGAKAASTIDPHGRRTVVLQLDVSDQRSVAAASRQLRSDLGRLDVLINNAAILYDTWARASSADLRQVQEALDTNLFGAWRTTLELLDLLRAAPHPRIVNVSSEGGSLASMHGGTPAYSVSKAALNALTRLLAGELRRDGILVNAVCPGWTATDMGGRGGRPVADGAAGIVWAATLPDDGPTGGFFRDGRPLPW
jgi:NAD(P)-dependent dehydrogenase (short-subunit alcohol dehydrogenase family)